MTGVYLTRNDSCLSRLRFEMTGASPALQAPTPTPLPPIGERGTSRWATQGRRPSPQRPVSFPSSPISLAAASPCASTSRIGGKEGIGGEQDKLILLTGSRTVRLAAPPPTPQNGWEVKTQDFSPSARNDRCGIGSK